MNVQEFTNKMTFNELSTFITVVRKIAFTIMTAIAQRIDSSDSPSKPSQNGAVVVYLITSLTSALDTYFRTECQKAMLSRPKPIDESWFSHECLPLIVGFGLEDLPAWPRAARLYAANDMLRTTSAVINWNVTDINDAIDAAYQLAKEFSETIDELNRPR